MKYLIFKKIFLYGHFPTVIDRGVCGGVYTSLEEVQAVELKLEEVAFKKQRLYLILKNDENTNRVGDELSAKFGLNIFKDGYLDFEFRIPPEINSDNIPLIKAICGGGFYQIFESEATENNFVVIPSDGSYSSENYHEINLIFESETSAKTAILQEFKSQIRMGETALVTGNSLGEITNYIERLKEWLNKYSGIFSFEEGYGYSGHRINFKEDEMFWKTGLKEVEELASILKHKPFEIVKL